MVCRPFLPLLVFLLPVALVAADLNSLTPAEKKAGWVQLFDGKSLSGWRSQKSEKPGATWRVEDGALVLRGRSGDLITVGQYGDFELSLEWRISEGGNSGILYRAGLAEAASRSGPEYQVLDNDKAKDGKLANHRAAALYDLVAPTKEPTKPVGQWNAARIVIRGWHIQHWLNGEKVVDVDIGSPAGRQMIAGSKFKAWPVFATLTRGHIALQDHGDVVSYRNIKLRELK